MCPSRMNIFRLTAGGTDRSGTKNSNKRSVGVQLDVLSVGPLRIPSAQRAFHLSPAVISGSGIIVGGALV